MIYLERFDFFKKRSKFKEKLYRDMYSQEISEYKSSHNYENLSNNEISKIEKLIDYRNQSINHRFGIDGQRYVGYCFVKNTYGNILLFNISKYVDEWYILSYNDIDSSENNANGYLCDTFEGLEQAIKNEVL